MFYRFLKKYIIPSNISIYLSRVLIIVTVATTLIIGGVLILQQNLYFSKLSKQKSTEYLNDQKIYIREIVQNELEYIKIQDSIFRQSINNKIEQNVNQAINTAETIYEKYKGKISDEEIKRLIVTTVSSIKFEMEYEDVFITNLDGTAVHYSRKPEFIGKNLINLKDENGIAVVQNEINLLKSVKEGFLEYPIQHEDNAPSATHHKITFVKKFKHYNWYFGSKQYSCDYFPEFREEITRKISTVRFRYGGYIFMNQTDGTPLVLDGKEYKGSTNLITNTDDSRKKVFRQQLDVVTNSPDGGYFSYNWVKLDGKNYSEKISFAKLYPAYNWILGAGFYIDEINQRIQEQQQILHREQRNSILTILLILIVLLIIEALIIYHFNQTYNADFDRFFNFFFSSKDSFNQLNISEFYFEEFKKAGIEANNMIINRQETENKLIQEQQKATESDRLKSAFLANMSHEIRTPMNAIIGFSELLEDEDQDENDKAVFIKLISKNGISLLNLINDIIDISKIESNLLSIHKRPLNLAKFLNEIEQHYTELLATKKDKSLEFKIMNSVDPSFIIETDELRLKQILDNLIGNAIKFTNSGSIIVAVRQDDGQLIFRVTDTGIGIPEDKIHSIFERFIQAHQGKKDNFGGTGLGLAISKNLIELLDGSIRVESAIGKGSTFEFNIKIS